MTVSKTQNFIDKSHQPNLNTILMVENALKESKSYPTKKELLSSLPKKIQYQTFIKILDYLEASNKIIINNRRITWVFADNPKLKELLETSVKLRRPSRFNHIQI
jgi:hypothetical protein